MQKSVQAVDTISRLYVCRRAGGGQARAFCKWPDCMLLLACVTLHNHGRMKIHGQVLAHACASDSSQLCIFLIITALRRSDHKQESSSCQHIQMSFKILLFFFWLWAWTPLCCQVIRLICFLKIANYTVIEGHSLIVMQVKAIGLRLDPQCI